MPSHVSSMKGCGVFFIHLIEISLCCRLCLLLYSFSSFQNRSQVFFVFFALQSFLSLSLSLSFRPTFFKEAEWTDEEKKIIILKFCTAFSSLYTFLLYSSCLQYTFLFMTSSLSSSSQVFTWGMIRSFSSCLVPSSSSFFFSSHSFDFSTNNKFSLFTLSLSSSLFLSLPVWLLGQRMGREERGEERGEGKREKSERKMKE